VLTDLLPTRPATALSLLLLQLVTAGDATDNPASSSLLKLASGKPDRPPRPAIRPISLLQKLASSQHSGSTQEAGSSEHGSHATAGAAPTSVADRSSSKRGGLLRSGSGGVADDGDGELGDGLEEGQVLHFTIALSQVASIECTDRRIKVGAAAHAGRR